jgi:hypothetical protein
LAAAVLFGVTRLFSGSQVYDLCGDQCKYLALAEDFPFHRLWGGELFLKHAPWTGWIIGLCRFVVADWRAGVMATLTVASLAWAACGFYLREIGLSWSGIVLGLVYVAGHRWVVALDTAVSRTPLVVLGTAASLAFLERAVRLRTEAAYRAAAVAVALTCLVSDQCLLLLPVVAARLALESGKPLLPNEFRRRLLVVLAGITILVWPAVRLYRYATNTVLATGIDGIPEIVAPIPWGALFQTDELPQSRPFTIRPFGEWSFPNLFTDMAGLEPAWPVVALLLILGSIADMRHDWRSAASRSLAAAFLYLPAMRFGYEWYSVAMVIPLAAVVAAVLRPLRRGSRADAIACGALAAVAGAAAAIWIAQPDADPAGWRDPRPGGRFIADRTPVTRGASLAPFLRHIPPDAGIMTHVCFAPEIRYVSRGPKVISLPTRPNLVLPAVARYNVRYLVLYNAEITPSGIKVWHFVNSNLESLAVLQPYLRIVPSWCLSERLPLNGPSSYLVFEVDRDGVLAALRRR